VRQSPSDEEHAWESGIASSEFATGMTPFSLALHIAW
jgi:hypothetical protein